MTTTAAPPAVAIGDMLGGRYRIDGLLGKGGVGIVYLAQDCVLERAVALKTLQIESAHHRTRLVREARAAAKLESEHVARVLDLSFEIDPPFLVYEYLEGRDMERRLAASGPLAVSDAAEAILYACEAIAEAHARGLIHRDLKPGNLFWVTRESGLETLKVLDFGIAKGVWAGTDEPSLTGSYEILGSLTYMSPEQIHSPKDVTPRTDIWALGTILYELLTGAPPFEADAPADIADAIVNRSAKPPREHREAIPVELEQAVMRCLEKDPAARFADVAAFASSVAPFAGPRSADIVARCQRWKTFAARHSATTVDRSLRAPPSSRPRTAPAQHVPEPAPEPALADVEAPLRVLSSAEPRALSPLEREAERPRLHVPAIAVGAFALGVLVAILVLDLLD